MAEIAVAFAFLSRLPVPRLEAAWRHARLGDALRFAPLVGLVIAAGQAIVLVGCISVRTPPVAAVILVVLTGVVLTGALHEDGLADVADSFGAATRDRKLAIMRDSRIGSYGALALLASVSLRGAALAGLLGQSGPRGTIGALCVAAACSRALMLVPLAALAPARSDGMAHAAGRLNPLSLFGAFLLAGLIALGSLLWTPLDAKAVMLAVVLGTGAVTLGTAWARRVLGGVTGDVVGAMQQVAEAIVLLTLASGR